MENLLNDDVTGGVDRDAYVCINGVYHGAVVMNTIPQMTVSGMMASMSLLRFKEYSIALKVRPINREYLGEHEDRCIERRERAFRANGKSSLASTIENMRTRVKRLLKGDSIPFHVQFIVHCWAESPETLTERLSCVAQEIQMLNGAKAYILDVPTSCRNAFFNTVPASGYWDDLGKHYLEDSNLAHLVPLCSGDGKLDTHNEVLFNAANGSLHGVDTFSKNTCDPSHCFITGITGGGKSALVMEILTQSECYFDSTIVLDNGSSYACLNRAFDKNSKVFTISEHGDEVLNCLSTNGQALASLHQENATKILELMAAKFVESGVYGDSFIFDRLKAFYEFWPTRHTENTDTSESWRTFYKDLPEDEQPTLSDFQKWLEQDAEKPSRYSDDTASLALILSRWCKANGGYSLLDGVGTISFTGNKMIYVELSKLSSASKEL